MKIPITRPCFDEAEKAAVVKPLDTGWVVQGPNVAEFERLFANYTGAAHALATSSCTTALHLALATLGIGPGDEVIVPAFTFVATANVVEYQRAKPVFVDIDLRTFNVDAGQIEARITGRTKAVIPVSLFGLSADVSPIMALGEQRGIFVVEDAACAVGARYNGCHAGTLAHLAAFSFHPRKVITVGEGGMVITQETGWAVDIKARRSHGGTISDLERHKKGAFALPEHNVLGFNYRMTDLQGALGVVQMKKLDWIIDRRRELARRYDEALSDLEGVLLPYVPEGYRHTYQSYVLLISDDARLSRDVLAQQLLARGISVRQGTHAVHLQGYYRYKYDLLPADFPNSLYADRHSLALPLFPTMTDDEQDFVIEQVRALAG
jgi:dTDP-4-amino-4,6-dideoxygalactose transaminase